MAEEKRRSYVIMRKDGLLLRTKPIIYYEAEWLYKLAYKGVRDRGARVRYLEEWGNVLNVSDYLERLKQLDVDLYNNVLGGFESPEEFQTYMGRILGGRASSKLKRLSEARQTLEGLLHKAEDFLRRPVEPRPIASPARYYETPIKHLTFECCISADDRIRPRPEWLAYTGEPQHLHGVSVFRDSFWMWRQTEYTRAVMVKRNADDREVINAVANDAVVQAFLRRYDEYFRELMMEHEAELNDKGYDDVIRKAKVVLTAADLLNAGRHEEEGVPT